MNFPMIFPPPDLLLPFLVAGIALNLTPGPDMTFVALSGARGGRTAGLAAAAGIFTGCCGHILFAMVGLSALIAASQTAFAVVKWIGVAYLLYLAIKLVRQKDGAARLPVDDAAFGPWQAFRQAALVNLLNPKVGIFFLAFLPQFVEPVTQSPWREILALGILFNTTGALVNALVGLTSAAAAGRLTASRWFGRTTRWFAATVMGGIAVKLALSRNN
jgi:threonine/homoserine/homoserine lactone efflux protein